MCVITAGIGDSSHGGSAPFSCLENSDFVQMSVAKSFRPEARCGGSEPRPDEASRK